MKAVDREIEKAHSNLEKAQGVYLNAICSVAEKAYLKYVKPFCEKNGCTFIAGNGTWWLEKDGKRVEPLPKRVESVLTKSLPEFPANDLGSLMPDFPEKS